MRLTLNMGLSLRTESLAHEAHSSLPLHAPTAMTCQAHGAKRPWAGLSKPVDENKLFPVEVVLLLDYGK